MAFVNNIARVAFISHVRVIGFLWALAEASVFFVLPDFFLVPAIIAHPRSIWRLVGSIMLGSAMGALIVALFVSLAPSTMFDIMVALPFTNEAMINKASEFVGSPLSSFWQAYSGVPMKTWIWAMMTGGASFLVFFGALLLGRLLRFSIVAGITLVVEHLFGKFIRKHAVVFWLSYIVIFFVSLALVANRV